MPRQLKVVVECDACHAPIDGEEHDGALSLTVNGVGPKQVDLCDACLSAVPTSELLFLFEQAATVPTPRRRGGTNSCPACAFVSTSAQGLGRHTRTIHGASVAELREKA